MRIINKLGFYKGIPVPISYSGLSKTYNKNTNKYYRTYYGDGIVANRLSFLSYASLDSFEGLNHSTLINDERVYSTIEEFLINNPPVIVGKISGEY